MTLRYRKRDLFVAWVIAMLVSALVAYWFYVGGKAADCKPGQIDGQCGLSSFLGLLYGEGAGLVIFVGTTICLFVVAYRRRRAVARDIAE